MTTVRMDVGEHLAFSASNPGSIGHGVLRPMPKGVKEERRRCRKWGGHGILMLQIRSLLAIESYFIGAPNPFRYAVYIWRTFRFTTLSQPLTKMCVFVE